MPIDRLRWQETLAQPVSKASEYISSRTGLTGGCIKRLMNAGGVWLERPRQPGKRLRRATAALLKGDQIKVFYDEALLALKSPDPQLIDDQGCFSVWYKPAGLLSQGNEWGDQHALLRKVELFFTPRRDVFLIHRLDREAMGLMVIAHNRQAAADLSQQWQSRQTLKEYRVRVKGRVTHHPITIEAPLDGKPAVTRVIAAEPAENSNQTLLDVEIETGRKHQIRRHLEGVGYPVMGDPQYGSGNQDPEGLSLAAIKLVFSHPRTKEPLSYTCPESLLPRRLVRSGSERS